MNCKVLHIHFGKEGGAERFFVNLARAFSMRGVEQQFFIRPGRSWEQQITELGPVYFSNFSRIAPTSLVAHWQANRIVKRWKPDAVMAWMPRAGRLLHSWPETIKLARMGDFPTNLKHFGNCDVLVGNLPGISEKCRELGWQRPVLTISNFPRDIIATTVDRSKLGVKSHEFLVAASGRLVPRKGFDVLIHAISRVPQSRLWLMGDGQEKGRLLDLARQLRVDDRVDFLGWVDEPINYVKEADAFVMPSRHEPLGNALLEAWAAQTPTLSTRSEGPTWYMRDNIDGILVSIDDVEAMTAGLLRIRNEPEIGKRFVQNASDRLTEMFSKDAVVDEYLKVFRGDFDGR